MEQLNETGIEAVPRRAATVIVLRGGRAGLDVLLVRRNPRARFMGGAWVFPGGAAHAGESDADAAVRELREEASLHVSADALVPFSRWITPRAMQTRFDTRFYVTPLPAGGAARVDGGECVDLRWMTPADALAAHARGELALVLPTIRHLEQLASYDCADDVFADPRPRDLQPVLPEIVDDGDRARIVLPGE